MRILFYFMLIIIFYIIVPIINILEKKYYDYKKKKIIQKYLKFTLFYFQDIIVNYLHDKNNTSLNDLLLDYYNDIDNLKKIKEYLIDTSKSYELNGPEFIIHKLIFQLIKDKKYYKEINDIPPIIRNNFIIFKLNKEYTYTKQIITPISNFNKDLKEHLLDIESELNDKSYYINEIIYPPTLLLFYSDGARGRKLQHNINDILYLDNKQYKVTKIIFKSKDGNYNYIEDMNINKNDFKRKLLRLSLVILEAIK